MSFHRKITTHTWLTVKRVYRGWRWLLRWYWRWQWLCLTMKTRLTSLVLKQPWSEQLRSRRTRPMISSITPSLRMVVRPSWSHSIHWVIVFFARYSCCLRTICSITGWNENVNDVVDISSILSKIIPESETACKKWKFHISEGALQAEKTPRGWHFLVYCF